MTVRVVKHAAGHSQLIGYARVSRASQSLEKQITQLKTAGCCRIYCEQVSGYARERPGFAAMLDTLRKGDSVVVVALDRLGRRMSETIGTLELLREQGCHFRDLRSGVDTRSPHGRVLLSFLAAVAEAEREATRERILEALKLSGNGGRPTVITPARIALAEKLTAEGHSPRKVAEAMGVSASTVRKMLLMRQREDPRQLRLTE